MLSFEKNKKSWGFTLTPKFGVTLQSKGGFTLIELLVSITIVAALSVLFLANYHSAGERSQLIVAAQKMASDIRRAQQFSLGSFGTSTPPLGGWGVYFDKTTPNSYILFADINNNKYYGAGEKFEQINLPAKVSLSGLADNSGEVTTASISFLPPDPVVYIRGSSGNKLTITLRESTNNSAKSVEVNYLGLVDVTQ